MSAFAEALSEYNRHLQSERTATTIEMRKSNKETFDFSQLSVSGMMPVDPGHIGIQLLDVSDDEQTAEWTFAAGDAISIGRATDRSVQIPDQRVSREHALITFQDGAWQYRNQGRNGTFVEGKLLDKFTIELGDTVQLGKRGPKLRFYPGE